MKAFECGYANLSKGRLKSRAIGKVVAYKGVIRFYGLFKRIYPWGNVYKIINEHTERKMFKERCKGKVSFYKRYF